MAKLSYAVLHGPIHHPDTGQIGSVLQTEGTAQIKPVKSIELTAGVVTVVVPNAKDKKRFTTFLIPLTGFTHTVLALEENSKV